MNEPMFDADKVIDAMAPLVKLEVAPEYRSGIAANLIIAARFADLILDFPLDDHAEPAAVFRP
jgi:Protein of unknown function (DUF4089)